MRATKLIATALILGPNLVYAASEFTPYASVSIKYDDNLFRQSASEIRSQQNVQHQDRLILLSTGVNGSLEYKRQKFGISLGFVENKYDNNSQLNNFSRSTNLRWNWQLGSNLSGIISTSDRKRLTDFETFTETLKLEQTQRQYQFSSNWRFDPQWSTGFRLQRSRVSYDNELFTAPNSNSESLSFNVKYRTYLDNVVTLSYGITDLSVNNVSTLENSGNYKQKNLSLSSNWNLTEKSLLSATLSRKKREYDNTPGSSLGKNSANINYSLDVTSKLKLKLAYLKDFSAQEDSTLGDFQTTLYSASTNWQATTKLNFALKISQNKKDFTSYAEQTTARNLTASFGYAFYKNFNYRFSYTNSINNSRNNKDLEYNANIFSFSIVTKF